jgi:hypothetical protein
MRKTQNAIMYFIDEFVMNVREFSVAPDELVY